MSDGELESIAQEAHELTDIARQALQEERDRRQAEDPADDGISKPLEDEADWEDTVVIKQFRDLPEALLAKGALDSAGLESFLADDNMVRMDWFYSNLVGGVKLCVRPNDADVASDLLGQPMLQDFEVEGVGTYQQPACPQCQSLDVSCEALNKPVAYTSAWIGVPIPVPRRRWKCHSCGSEWQEQGAE
ncbi:MAG: hypothetical protein ABSE85_21300 [Candidatus Korobacteraceae bacterium]